MPKYFTHYWSRNVMPYNLYGEPVNKTVGRQLHEHGVAKGDVIYVIHEYDGDLRLAGKFIVGENNARGPASRGVPLAIAKRLKLHDGSHLKFKSQTKIDVDSLRGVHRLTAWSAKVLEKFIAADNAGLIPFDDETQPFSEGVVDIDLLGATAAEGRPKLVLHLRRERNPALVRRKRKQALASTGSLACEACGFAFESVYGSLGHEFCEVHHKRPLSTSREVVTSLDDLAVLCSNCHRMIHRSNPMQTVAALARLIKRRTKA